MKKQIVTIILATATILPAGAQHLWSLRDCIDYAQNHNLSIKQKEAAVEQGREDLTTARWSRVPDLSASVGQKFNYGRGLKADNTFADRNTQSTAFSLGTTVPLFTGFQLPVQRQMAGLNLKAAVEDLGKAREDISIAVTGAYLQVLFSNELLQVAESQLNVSREVYEMKKAGFEVGRTAEKDVLEAASRVSSDELSQTRAQNEYQLNLLALSQLLELPSPDDFGVQSPDTAILAATLPLPGEVYAEAVGARPSVLSAVYRARSAHKGIKLAQSGLYPKLSMSAGLGTNYYKVSGLPAPSFGDQWSDNFNKFIGFNLSIPLFNRMETRGRIRKARIQSDAARWQLEEVKKSLFKEIQQAYYNAVAAHSRMISGKSSEEASQAAFRLVSANYQLGRATATEYNESRAQWLSSVSENIKARYDYIFRVKILNFYRGIPL